MVRTALPILVIFLMLGSLACSDSEPPRAQAQTTPATATFPGTPEGAKALLQQFLKPDADYAGLTRPLRPTPKDFKSVFKGKALKEALEGYRAPWDEGKIVVRGKPDQTQLLIWSATSEELKKGTGDAKAFPGGYVRVAPHLKNGLTFYRFKFVRPGETLGFAWDGLVYVNGHWVIFPKPWRVLKDKGS